MPKQTAKNNDLLKKAKRVYGPKAYRCVSEILNRDGEGAARDYLTRLMPSGLDEYLDQMGDLYDNLKEWPTR